MPVKRAERRGGLGERHAGGARRAERGQRVRDIVAAGHLQADLDRRRRVALADLERDAVRRGRDGARQQIGLGVREAVGQHRASAAASAASAAVSSLSRLSTAISALATKSRNSARSSSIDLWSSEMLFSTATRGRVARDGAVALVDLADEDVALADQRAGEGRVGA